MDVNAMMQAAMQDPAARDFITKLLARPDPRAAQLAQIAAQPQPGPDFSWMQQPQDRGGAMGSFDSAYGMMDEMLKGFDPTQAAAPQAPAPAMPGGAGAPGAVAPAPAAGQPNPMTGYQEGDITSSPLPPTIGGMDISLLDQMLQGLAGRPAGGRV